MFKKLIVVVGMIVAINFMVFRAIDNKPVSSSDEDVIRNGVVYYATDDMEVIVNRSDNDTYDIYLCQYFGGQVDNLEYRGRYVQSNLLDGVNDTVEYYYEQRQ